jgi:VanZ family protein
MLALPHGRLLLALGWIFVVLVVAGSLGPPVTGAPFSISDKVQHFAAYFVLTLWFTGLYPRDRLLFVVLGFFCLGGLIELLQGLLTETRQMDVIDVAANSLGIAAATVVAALGLSSWALRLEAWWSRRNAGAAARKAPEGKPGEESV